MPEITTAITDPEGTDIVTGSLIFVADETNGTVLKSTSATTTPGTSVTLLDGDYKVYYIDGTTQVKRFIGTIVVAAPAALVDLL